MISFCSYSKNISHRPHLPSFSCTKKLHIPNMKFLESCILWISNMAMTCPFFGNVISKWRIFSQWGPVVLNVGWAGRIHTSHCSPPHHPLSVTYTVIYIYISLLILNCISIIPSSIIPIAIHIFNIIYIYNPQPRTNLTMINMITIEMVTIRLLLVWSHMIPYDPIWSHMIPIPSITNQPIIPTRTRDYRKRIMHC